MKQSARLRIVSFVLYASVQVVLANESAVRSR